jgi:hypothetical protein
MTQWCRKRIDKPTSKMIHSSGAFDSQIKVLVERQKDSMKREEKNHDRLVEHRYKILCNHIISKQFVDNG